MTASIFTQRVLVVIQTWRNDFLPDYDVFDQNWIQVASAKRAVPSGVEGALGVADEAPLEVFDMNDTLLFRAGSRTHARPAVFLENSNGEEIGWLIRMGGILKPRFNLEYQGRRVGSIEVADRLQRVVYIRDRAGSTVGDIRTISNETPFVVPDDTDGYYLTLHQDLLDPLRTLVVGCTVVLQSVIGSESKEPVVLHITSPGIPAMLDWLRRRSRG